jgi:para-nitrobenzyl esterase
VIVTINYRLGVFGFLDLAGMGTGSEQFDSNIGLRDVLAALRWVRDNIAAFGGDPARVTLFGESAGAGIVTALLAVPQAGGLFSAAIAQSSPATSVYEHERAQRVTHLVLDHLGIAEADAGKLRDVDVRALIAATKEVFDEIPTRNPGTVAFVPVVDGDLLHGYPVQLAREGRTHPVPLIIGTNKHEAALFRLMRSPLLPITPRAITSMFNDIAADRAGTRFGALAVSGGAGLARLQPLVARGPREADLIPDVRDLPEFMAEPEFIRRFGGVGAPPYRRMMADIEQRIAALPLYR